MSTSALIGVMYPNGQIDAIRLHLDGYPSRAGGILNAHYASDEKADDLVSMGDASSLEATIASSVFYERDRGEHEDAVAARRLPDSLAFHAHAKASYINHAYLWTGVKWEHTACS